MTAASVIDVYEVSKSFPGVVALQDVSLSLTRGEIVGLVGKNGAGKSTLINVLSGSVRPDTGLVRIDGETVQLRDPRDARSRGIAVVHQEIEIAQTLSIAENMSVGGHQPKLFGCLLDKRQLREKCLKVLARLGCDDLDPGKAAGSLSVPQRRLLMICKALWDDARVIILDEPTESLTRREADRLHALVRSLAAEGVTVVYVSHRLDDVMDLASRIVVMRDGQVVDDRPRSDMSPAELFTLISGSPRNPVSFPGASLGSHPAANSDELLRLDYRVGSGISSRVTVQTGEVLGIAGLVGSGRTRLLRTMYGADSYPDARVTLGNMTYKTPSPRRSISAGLGLLPEERRSQGLFGAGGTGMNITIASQRQYRHWHKVPLASKRNERRAARNWIDRLEIAGATPEKPVTQLSGGNQQKVLLARWLARDARILLMDEPTNGVDVGAKREIHGIIRSMAEQSRAVVLVASDFQELCDVATRVVVLRKGLIVGELTGDLMTEENILRLCYDVGAVDDFHPVSSIEEGEYDRT